MKSSVLLFVLCASIAVPALHAFDAPPARQHKKQTELGEHMEKMGHAFRTLGREVNNPAKNEDSLKQIAIIKTNAEAASKLEPAKEADIAAENRAKFSADFHEKMKGLLADVDSLEAALKAGNNAEAGKLAKKIKQDMDEGHKAFRKKMDDDM